VLFLVTLRRGVLFVEVVLSVEVVWHRRVGGVSYNGRRPLHERGLVGEREEARGQ